MTFKSLKLFFTGFHGVILNFFKACRLGIDTDGVVIRKVVRRCQICELSLYMFVRYANGFSQILSFST